MGGLNLSVSLADALLRSAVTQCDGGVVGIWLAVSAVK